MCGIGGMIDWRAATSADRLRTIGEGMNEALRHRGPDGEGLWTDAEGGAMLAQRRLAIIDLSPGGVQPMHSADRRFVITFNGEIYNYRDIRSELAAAGCCMRSNSDTEVLLEACSLWGVEAAVERAIGMFAFALWDRLTRTLWLVRDRLGIKPLYYAATADRVLFASQLKAFRAAPDWKPAIDNDAVVGFLRHGYIGQPHTIYREAAKLPPGHILALRPGRAPELTCFWDARAVALAGQSRNDPAPDQTEAVEHLDALLRDSVKLRMIADVPLGAFLSGGIDSSTVVALMQAQSTRPVKTFSIGFHAAGYDEAQYAKRVAVHLHTDHTEFYVEPKHALELVPRLADWFDEPFADVSQIPTYLVSELTRKHVTVALSGDGGDELFAGYNRYLWAERLTRAAQVVPRGLHGPLAAVLRALSPETWTRLFERLPFLPRAALPGDRLHKLATVLDDPSPDAIYRRIVSQWERPQEIAVAGQEPSSPLWDASVARDFPDLVPRMQFLDLVTYLPDDILTKIDRATMAVGLEGRVPLIDHRVVAYAWSLPMQFKVRGRESKWLLRRVLDRYVPKELIDRPKMGFGVPIDSWLRGPLRDWAETLLAPARLAADGLVRVEPVRRAWAEHLAGTRNWQYPLWTLLMLQAWRERWT
ncbi:MAG: asparagine synthase (glutamine-hydrolyzing) [Xanthobacteraceae bacterium]